MKKADLKQRCDKFIAEIAVLRDRGQRVLDAQKVLGRTSDKRWIFEALAVNLVTSWSDFVEDIFYGCVNRDSAAVAKTLGLELPKHLTLATCEAIFTTNGFFDVRDTGDLIGKAKKFIGKTHPFGNIAPADRTTLDQLMTIRNYVVHRSRVARNRYRPVLANHGITTLISPGRFLLNALADGDTRLERCLAAAERAAQSIRATI